LNSVLGFAKLLDRTKLNDTQSTYLSQVIGEGEMLNRLVSDLLDSAHLSTGKLTLKREPCDINVICAAVAEEHQPNVGPDVVLQLDRATGLPTLHCDPVRLRQALGNLVSNAVKHTQQGRIIIRTRQRGDVVQIAISDTGPGIAEEQLQLIFVPFVQLDAHSRGVGLGLDIALQLVRLHGGEIRVESTVGQGSTFTIELPVQSTPPDHDTSAN
jgi:signal transduction histidine kinase